MKFCICQIPVFITMQLQWAWWRHFHHAQFRINCTTLNGLFHSPHPTSPPETMLGQIVVLGDSIRRRNKLSISINESNMNTINPNLTSLNYNSYYYLPFNRLKWLNFGINCYIFWQKIFDPKLSKSGVESEDQVGSHCSAYNLNLFV